MNSERLIVQCDKSVCIAGDTLWWHANMVNGAGFSKSTNLYAELWNGEHCLITRHFPILYGQSLGQMTISDSIPSGVYWLRIFTKNQALSNDAQLTVIPITIYHEQDDKIKLMKKHDLALPYDTSVQVVADTINTDADGLNSWLIKINTPGLILNSCAVTDAGLPYNQTVYQDTSINYDTLNTDSVFLSISGFAHSTNGKPIKNKQVVVFFQKEGQRQSIKVLPVNEAGRFNMAGWYFFGKAQLLYQLNNGRPGSKDIVLTADTLNVPKLQVPPGWNIKTVNLTDSLPKHALVAHDNKNQYIPSRRQLKEVKIKAWRSPRKALDSTYTSGAFSEPALYSFDLRNEKYDVGLAQYLRTHFFIQGGYSAYDAPQFPNHPILFYVNEELATWDEISDMLLNDIAYIKAFPSDFIGNDPFTKWLVTQRAKMFSDDNTEPADPTKPKPTLGLTVPNQPTPMIIAIYTRKGKDIKPIPGLNSLTINGYDSVRVFNPLGNRKTTLLWVPLAQSNLYRVRFHNTNAKRFRITISGSDAQGKEIYFSKVLPN